MITYFSCRITLDKVVSDLKHEKVVIENIKRCKRFAGKGFRLILWNKNLSVKEVKDFIDRNEKDLFDVNTKITKRFTSYCWLLVDDSNEDKSRFRFKYTGNILDGLVKYIELLKKAKGLMGENSNRR